MKKEELENAIKEYLMHHASLSIMCNQEGDCSMKVCVSLWLDDQKITDASNTIFLF